MEKYYWIWKNLGQELDMDRVQRLKEDVAKDKYAVAPDKIAEKLIDYLQRWALPASLDVHDSNTN